MTFKLAVFTAQLGTASETFIRRHVENLVPGRTVAIAQRVARSTGGRWVRSAQSNFLIIGRIVDPRDWPRRQLVTQLNSTKPFVRCGSPRYFPNRSAILESSREGSRQQ